MVVRRLKHRRPMSAIDRETQNRANKYKEARLEELFSKIDSDSDGQLTRCVGIRGSICRFFFIIIVR